MKKLLVLLLAAALTVSLFAPAVMADDKQKLLEITWAGHGDTVPPAEDGTRFQKYLEEKWNVKIHPLTITHMEKEAWDLHFASGNTADYISNRGGDAYNTLIQQQLVRPIPYEWLETYAPNWMKKTYDMVGSKELTRKLLTHADGNVYCMPYTGYTLAFGAATFVRKDWMEKLGLSMPKTLDEYHDLIKAFVEKDPDGNGKNDTLGISGANFDFHYVFGAHGIMRDTYNLQEDGSVTYSSVSEAYKNALKTLATWYKEGLIDPETFTDDRAALREKWSSGMIGLMNDVPWWAEAARGKNGIIEIVTSRNPAAKVSAFPAVSGPEGKSGALRWFPNITGMACVMFGADTSDEKVIRIMQIKESLTTGEEHIKALYGEKDVNYTVNEDGVLVMNPDWDFEKQRAEGVGSFYATQPRSIEDASLLLQPRDIEINNIVLQSNTLFSGVDFVRPRKNEAQSNFGNDVNTIVKEYYANAILGKVDIDSTWDSYVKQVNEAGLLEILKEYEAMLKEAIK